MGEKNTNKFIKWIEFYLRMAAILRYLSKLDNARIVYYVCAMSVACVSGWYMFYLKYNDFSQNTDALLHAVLVGHTLFVYVIYLTNREKLLRIAKRMNERFAHYNLHLGLCRYHQLWDRADRLSLLMMKLGSASCLVMYSAYFLNAFSFSTHRKLLYPIWVPFSIDNDINYAITVILQLTIFSLYSFIHVSGCGFCIGGSHFIGASYDVLGNIFQDFCNSQSSKLYNNQSQVKRKLKWFVEAHLELLSMIRDYKDIYETIIIEVLLSCEVIICFAGFQIVLATEAQDYARGATVLTMALLLTFHLFMFCYPGQHIYNKSEQFRDSVYESEWEDHSVAVQKSVQIMLVATLQPVSISYHNLVHASMHSFLNTLRTAFSYVNILLILREIH